MGTSINWLSKLPQEEQERVLEQLEKIAKLEKYLSNQLEDEREILKILDEDDANEGNTSIPIEINGTKYWIHQEVMFLIESLHKQLNKKKYGK